MTGSTLTDLVFNLPGNTDTQLEDNGIPAHGDVPAAICRWEGEIDPTTFGHPTSSSPSMAQPGTA